MNVFLLFLSLVLVSFAVLIQLRFFILTDLIDKILAFGILFSANIVLCTQVLSELHFISSAGYLVAGVIIAVASLSSYLKFGLHSRVSKDGAPPNDQTSIDTDRVKVWMLRIFLASIVIIALISLFLAVTVPANVWDSMTYHLSRVGHWLQNGTLKHYYSQDFRQTSMPPNNEILFLWTISFLKDDVLVNIFCWLTYIGLGLLIFRAAQLLGYGIQAALFSALVFLSLPYVILASSSSKNDLSVAFFALAFFYFFHSGCESRCDKKLILSGIAIGLAVGTKGTIFYVAPWLFIASLIIAFSLKTKPVQYLKWIGFCLIGVVLFGSYNYVQNYQSYGNPFAPKTSLQWFHKKASPEKVLANAIRYGYEALDFRGLPEPFTENLNAVKETIGQRVFPSYPLFQKYFQSKSATFPIKSRQSYHEGYEWYGFLGFFLYLPILLIFFGQIVVKKRMTAAWGYALVSVLYFVSVCAIMGYAHNRAGKILFSVAFIAPFVSSICKDDEKSLRLVLIVLISCIAINTAGKAVSSNSLKPMRGSDNVFDRDYYHKRTHVFKRIIPFMRFIEEVAQKGSRIGHVTTVMDWDYLMFGRDFSRVVIPIKKSELKKGEMGLIEKYQLDYLIIRKNRSDDMSSLNPIFQGVQEGAVLHVFPKTDWKEILNERLSFAEGNPDQTATEFKEIFDACLNSNAASKALSELSSGTQINSP